MELKQIPLYPAARFFRLLIVPYGIETVNTQCIQFTTVALLIVPYGIETLEIQEATRRHYAFNCTLWN